MLLTVVAFATGSVCGCDSNKSESGADSDADHVPARVRCRQRPIDTPAAWVRTFGNDDLEGLTSLAVDSQGNVLVTGWFFDEVDFGGGARHSAGGADHFVAKYDAAGHHVWSHRYGDHGDQSGSFIAVDGDGNAALTVHPRESVDFGGGPLTGADAGVPVAKLDATGAHAWSGMYGGTAIERPNGIAVDSSSAIVVVGHVNESVVVNGVLRGDPKLHGLAMKLTASGDMVWTKIFDGNGHLDAVLISPTDDIVILGSDLGTFEIDGHPVGTGQRARFVAALDSEGRYLWSRSYPTVDAWPGPMAFAIGPEGEVVLCGGLLGTMDFGHGPVSSDGAGVGFLVKLSAYGELLWSNLFRNDAASHIAIGFHAVAVDAEGDIVVMGAGYNVKLGGGEPGFDGRFLAAFTGEGVWKWDQPLCMEGLPGGHLDVDMAGDIVIASDFEGAMDLGTGVIESHDGGGIVIAKYDF